MVAIPSEWTNCDEQNYEKIWPASFGCPSPDIFLAEDICPDRCYDIHRDSCPGLKKSKMHSEKGLRDPEEHKDPISFLRLERKDNKDKRDNTDALDYKILHPMKIR